MSADVPTVVLPGPAMVPLVRAAAALEAEDIPPFAVIGGVAVTVRLGRAVRATADLDAVTDQRYTPTALEVLRARGDATYDAADPHTITSGEVQFQDVEPVDDADVVDRPGWVAATAEGMERLATPAVIKLAAATGARNPGQLTRAVAGQQIGFILGFLSGKVLGQFDPLGGDQAKPGRLLLVAPNIVKVERELGADPTDFRLWVCLHEQTHAAQFGAAPWLRDHLVGQLAQVANGAKLDESVALMTFLEGHADLITDRAAQGRIAAIRALRTAFRRRVGPRRRGILGALDKSAQYRDGLAFCRAVTKRKRQALDAAFESPANLPTLDEIAEPPAWLSRVHG